MEYKVVLKEEAKQDLKELDNSIAQKVLKKLEQLKKNPFLGYPLGNKMGANLSGAYKIYLEKKKIRVVYTVENNVCTVEVIAIGKREKGEVYTTAFLRIQS